MGTIRIAGIVALLAAGALGCGGSAAKTEATPGPQWAGQLTVNNRSNSDMDIYVARRSDRVRVGLAPNNQVTIFKISPAQVAGVGAVRFLAIPLAASATKPISSEPVTLSPTDTVTMDIPPS